MGNKKYIKEAKRKIRSIGIMAIVGLLIFGAGVLYKSALAKAAGEKKNIISISKLVKMVNISEMNTFKAVYNGIAEVANEEKPEKIDYYVSYEAKVNAGFDFEKLEIVKEEEAKRILITIPEIEITDTIVDIESLDYMFYNKKADKSSVSEQAYKACINDVESEIEKEIVILDLAKENAINITEALVRPFIEEFGPEYELVIK